MGLSEAIKSLNQSIQAVANPNNDPSDKLDEIENALRDVATCLEEIQDAFRSMVR